MRDFFDVSSASDNLYRILSKSRDAASYVSELWGSAEPYLDDGRPEAAANDFHSVFWEMYLVAALLDRGLPVTKRELRRRRNGGPDIQIGDVDAWVEAVTAGEGSGDDAVPPLRTDGSFAFAPDIEILLRITNAIDAKWKKYNAYRESGLVKSGEPFIIAINGARLPCARQGPGGAPRIVRAVFGIGPLVVLLDPETGQCVGEQFVPMPSVIKSSGAEVETGYFCDSQYSGISAVMWGTVDAWNRPDTFGRDIFLVHNPLAAVPLSRGWFREGVEFWAEDGKVFRRSW
ncbi:MAG: hypothetical protein WC538_02345 [Thermoanaerobaculia bacterium]|jgi:type I restriction enzyme S subunit